MPIFLFNTCTVEGIGEACLPKSFLFLVVFAGEAGKHHEKRL